MKRGTIGFIEPVPRVERQKLDLCAFGQFSRLIDDKTTRLDSSLQCHATTVASARGEDKPRGTLNVSQCEPVEFGAACYAHPPHEAATSVDTSWWLL